MFNHNSSEQPLSFKDLAAVEPDLAVLRKDAQAVTNSAIGDPRFCQHLTWCRGYGQQCPFKERVVRLVGFAAHYQDQRLRSDAAWQTVVRELLAVLPPCRDCACAVS